MTTAPRLTIDLSALAENWQALNAKSPRSETAAVVKANAYGLGIEQAVPALGDAGCNTFFTAMVEEGVRVRKCLPDANIFILNGIFSDTIGTAVEYGLAPVLSSLDQISIWSAMANGRPCALHIDTGMNRLGLDMIEARKLAEDSARIKKSGAQLLMSHLACGDDPDHPQNTSQLANFQECVGLFPKLKPSFANSAAILSNPDTHFEMTRPGIAMYGGEAVNDVPNPMKPVVKSETRILQIRTSKKGDAVGYGAAHVLERDSKVAICSAGYADGYHRASSGCGVPLRGANAKGGFGQLGAHKVPLIGRVSMDLTAFDVTDVPEDDLKNSSWIELFGPNILVDDAARACGTIGYELLTGLGSRYQREYLS